MIIKPIAKGPTNNPNEVCISGIALTAPSAILGLLMMPEIKSFLNI
jgi:hypothetical protein